MLLYYALAAVAVTAVQFLLSSREPLRLKGRGQAVYLLASALLNGLTAYSCHFEQVNMAAGFCRFALTNGLLMMTVTDMREHMVYDVHFFITLAGGIVTAVSLLSIGTAGRVLLFLFMLSVLYLAGKRSSGIGFGDTRMIACLALYFSFTEWMEVMLLALGSSLIFSAAAVLLKKKTMKSEIPFMPFLLFGTAAEYFL